DVNHDNVGGTIGDLVSLINTVISGTNPTPKTLSGEDLTASISTETHGNGMEVMTRSGCAVGAVLLNLQTSENFGADNIENLTGNMTVDYDRDGDQVRVLLYSLDGETLPSGTSSLVRLTGLQDVALSSVSMASADGQDMAATLAKDASLPSSFTLHQNYPNPFNPETRIDFELPSNSRVTLTIYNVLGKQVSILINDNLPAGVHSVVWDGKDDRGTSVASGVYLYRIETDFGQSTRKMMLLK
ncbi:MAG TPA: T9SS type A sorting domain-containing protein, partial [candidate division Zixibacteria bacterium]|nr:T9SS type A sorting domain-containing protein [candidate division Zixibacteria bacterium]